MNARKLLSAAKAVEAAYIEDVFSTYLYTGNGSTQTITNGIDLSGKGGLVWVKGRSGATDHALYDTTRGATKDLVSNSTAAETTQSTGLTAFSSTGFSIGALAKLNTNTATYASWTFRKQAKFFDVVTYTGNGTTNRAITHSLESTPGMVIVKRTDSTGDWIVCHRNISSTRSLFLNTTAASTPTDDWGTVPLTNTTFVVGGTLVGNCNINGATYVAYLFAHDAGGFGASGSDNVISCGSFTTDGSGNATVTLGYEPQFVITKPSSTTGQWVIIDSMRGFTADKSIAKLTANSSAAETTETNAGPTATGFAVSGYTASSTAIYIAIRRGPMKTPTTGTSVYNAIARTGTGAAATVTGVGFAPDLAQIFGRDVGANWAQMDRLRGTNKPLGSNLTAAEDTGTDFLTAWGMDGVTLGANSRVNASGGNFINYFFRRAPGFFDVVCYTGTGAPQTVNHNLGIAPELIIGKQRNGTFSGQVWHKDLGFYSGSNTYGLYLFSTSGSSAKVSSNAFGGSPTSTTFVASTTETAQASSTFVAYLFATVAGVSKVGSYTGTGSTLQIDCGFTGGARFVLIKRADSTGDWYVWDSARGIVAGNDPYLLLNSTAAEVTSTDYVDTYSAGFEISSTAPVAINANGGSFIFLAIA